MRVSRYTEWSYDLGSITEFLWISTSSENPRIVKVGAETHRALLTNREGGDTAELAVPGDVLTELLSAEIVVRREKTSTEIIQENSAASRHGRVLRRVILPSAQCPHGCGKAQFGAYCGQNHGRSTLSSAHQDLVLAEIGRLLDSGDYDTLSVAFFGAEPLTEPEITEHLLRACRQLARRRSIEYLASIVTSGLLLTTRVAGQLHAAGLSHFEVTIDGLEASHDARRPTAAGAPTFRKTIENLNGIAGEPALRSLSGTIRMNVDRRNIGDSIPLFRKLKDQELWPRLGFYIAPIRDWGKGHARADYGLEPIEFGRLEVQLFTEQLRSGAKATILPHRKRVVCTAVRTGSSVIDPFGVRHSCTETPLSAGENPIVKEGADWNSAWTRLLAEGTVPCRECNLLPVCGGACPKDWMLGRTPCPSFKYNLRERIQIAHLFGETRWC